MYFIVSEKTGVRLYGLPTTRRAVWTVWPFRTTFSLLIGNVDENIVVAQIIVHPAPALEIDLDLPDAVGNRHVELFKGCLGNDAVLGEAMAGLERSDRRFECGVVCVAPRSRQSASRSPVIRSLARSAGTRPS